jgi:hypothetical protein
MPRWRDPASYRERSGDMSRAQIMSIAVVVALLVVAVAVAVAYW